LPLEGSHLSPATSLDNVKLKAKSAKLQAQNEKLEDEKYKKKTNFYFKF
jgi:hypothetical protein